MEDDQFRMLIDHLGYSWAGYRKVRRGVKKRIRRHMQRMGCRDIAAYLAMLDDRQDLQKDSELLMTVSISRFFRDRRLWERLEQQWLQDILASKQLRMKVWSAGCACGEEVYSFKIIWERLKKGGQSLPELEVLATDLHPQYLERARRGIYNVSGLNEIPSDIRSIFFDCRKSGKQFAIKDEFKKNIRWDIHDLLAEPPGFDFNVVFLRNNILTYYREETQQRTVTNILDSLAPRGLLIIGCHETLPVERVDLIPMENFSYVFKKQEG